MQHAKRPQLRRLMTIHRELQAGRFPTARQLAEINETNEKTARRDLDFLRIDCGAPVEYSRKHRGWRYTSPTYQLPQLTISEGELVALFLAEQMLRQHRGLPYEDELRRAVQKLAEMLPDEISVRWQVVEQTHSFRSSVVSLHDVDQFRKLADAVLNRRQLKITYYTASRDAESTCVVDPWHLTCVDGEWYLIGFCHTRQNRRMFAPGRIRNLEPTGKTFQTPPGFQIGDYLGETFKLIREDDQPLQLIRLRFSPTAAKYVREKVWHSTQDLRMNLDGSANLELSLRSLIEIRRWIFSWGSECEVLAPLELRKEIALQAATIASRSELPEDSSASKPKGIEKGAKQVGKKT